MANNASGPGIGTRGKEIAKTFNTFFFTYIKILVIRIVSEDTQKTSVFLVFDPPPPLRLSRSYFFL